LKTLRTAGVDTDGDIGIESSLGFISWLAEKASCCTTDEERRELEDLCGQLMVHREMLEAHPEEAGAGLVPSLPAGVDISPALAQQMSIQAAMADGVTTFTELAEAGNVAAEELRSAMQGLKKTASTEIMGRQMITEKEYFKMLAAAPEERILDALLSVIDPLERVVLLEDALTPADESDADSASDEEDVVSTTPLRLLQFVDKQLIAAKKGTTAPSPGATTLLARDSERLRVLKELREEIYQRCEPFRE